MDTAVVLFTGDLRVHDHPAFREALRRAESVAPLFVLDETILKTRFATPNRVSFLVEALQDLRANLRTRGADLIIRRGDKAHEVERLARRVDAGAVFVSGGVTAAARSREERLTSTLGRRTLVVCDGTTIVAPDALKTYKVFTPYWNAWREAPRRPVERAPATVRMPTGVDPGGIPDAPELVGGHRAPETIPGGETEARRRFNSWGRTTLRRYDEIHDDLAADDTSKFGAALHFGCLSAREVEHRFSARPGGEELVRQLCWRDFHHQTVWAFPSIASRELRPRGRRWNDDTDALEAWKAGLTGLPIVDAGMRQLLAEGWMHNRARMITGSFLCKHLGVDWRHGGRHFMDHLVDGDIANNYANWQWVAGTGNDTRPNRLFNPIRQAKRFDPDGTYVRRHIPELASLSGRSVHEPWRLGVDERDALDYPDRIID